MPRTRSFSAAPWLGALAGLVGSASLPADAADAPAEPGTWWSGVKVSGQIEAGFTANPDRSGTGTNFGQLFTDKPNQLLLNQALLTAERPIDPSAAGYDFGFKLQGMYGTDARYTHFLNEFDRIISERTQLDVVEANVAAHLPWLTAGGVDAKLGQYPTPLGYEVIDAKGNPLYSHSYIFNFGLPFKHTGLLTTTHVDATLDIYAGIDTGVNTSLGKKGDDNDAIGGIAGIGLNNLAGGKLTVLALTHIGPENPRSASALGVHPNGDLRYLNDVVITVKASDALTFTTELNYIRDDGFHAQGYGGAQYVQYSLSDTLAVVGRGEVWRDQNGFFVAAFPGNRDFVNAERGLPAQLIGGGRTTYGALTVGLNIKPAASDMPLVSSLMIRPELRYDRSLNGTRPFDDSSSRDQFTAAVDVVVGF